MCAGFLCTVGYGVQILPQLLHILHQLFVGRFHVSKALNVENKALEIIISLICSFIIKCYRIGFEFIMMTEY